MHCVKGAPRFPYANCQGGIRPAKITVGNNVIDWEDELARAHSRSQARGEKWTIYRWADHYGGPLNSRHAEITSISHTTATLGTYPPHTYGGATWDNDDHRASERDLAGAQRSGHPSASHRDILPLAHSSRASYSGNRAFESSIYSESKIDPANGPLLALCPFIRNSYFATSSHISFCGLDRFYFHSRLLPYNRQSKIFFYILYLFYRFCNVPITFVFNTRVMYGLRGCDFQ